VFVLELRMPEVHPLPGSLVPLYGASDKSTAVSKQRPGLRLLMKLSVALTTTCTLLFLIVFVPHIHSHFYLISGSSGASHGAQYSSGDLAGLSDRIVPYKTRIGYFTYSKPLTDDRVIAIFQPRYAPGADVRDEVPSLRGMRPGTREQYIDDLYPEVLRIDPQFVTGGMVSLIGLRFGASGSACKCNFGGVNALSCEVKSPELAIIQLPSAAHFQMFREANMSPPFIEVTLDSHAHVGVSRIHLNSDAQPHQSSDDARKSSQASHQTIIYCQGHKPSFIAKGTFNQFHPASISSSLIILSGCRGGVQVHAQQRSRAVESKWSRGRVKRCEAICQQEATIQGSFQRV
jgi:hypothetical protein